jgi:hypothetical protein
MAVFADFERLLERIFERTSARVFRTRLQPVQLERRVERAMELGRVVERDRTRVPERLSVRIHPTDLRRLSETGLDDLAGRLADSALRAARARSYHLADRPTVSLVADPSVQPGEGRVDAHFGERAAPATTGMPQGAPEPRGGEAVEDDTRRLVFKKPIISAPRALLREIRPDGSERVIEIDGTVMTIGRGVDNGIVLGDGRVSRHHGRLQARRGALVYTDTGSTNGTRVNGLTVDEIVLGLGDLIQLGDTVLVVESLPA